MASAFISSFRAAAPFWVSLLTVPLVIASAAWGGLWVLAVPLFTFVGFTLADGALGLNLDNPDTETDEAQLFWYRLVTLIWCPVQVLLLLVMLAWVPGAAHLNVVEKIVIFFGLGVVNGAIGIVYAHELVHQRNRLERWLGDLLLASVLYSHFRSEHLLVHHTHVGTRRDAVTARYNEGYWAFLWRVMREEPVSAFWAEKAMLARKGLPWWHRSNPHWRYWGLQLAFIVAAWVLGGWAGFFLFLYQALVAVWLLELTNYIEHYGLTRKHMGNGRYEPVRPHHSWNASHKATNWLLINLQRHSDHHYKPSRRFPLLQTYDACEAPQLPYGYPAMGFLAAVPPLWRRRMNPRVRKWRAMYYPEITDWEPYKRGELPLPG
ncbi:alkane 1-monooxygenase [Vannielia litorea]|uniref:alkane 1-monooxygenase n=1 Tax=Vannielia litorea TaxID=1217970 RepID=UPI001BCDEF7F|nr:alkane 1-monooxygenase [Vannielia litorea]MBS8225402.1 alkane 1-monooxygenase [Vannielia litorea]